MTTQATAPIPEGDSSRRFARSSTDRVIAGVAGGLGRYFSIDPVVVRIIFVVLVFFGGASFVAYGAAWLLVPLDTGEARFGGRDILRRAAVVIGVLLATFVLALCGAWAVA